MNYVRKNVNVCKYDSFNYKGFIVQRGFIFGQLTDETCFVSNGKQKQNNSIPFFNCYVYNYRSDSWHKIRVTIENSQLFNLILKGMKKREEKGIDLVYHNSDELETIRWNNDEQNHHYPKSAPYKQARCTIPNKNDEYALKRKTMRERWMMTQRENRCIYNSSNGKVTII